MMSPSACTPMTWQRSSEPSGSLLRGSTPRRPAAYLGCKLSRVRKLTSSGDLPVEHDGRRVLYELTKLDEFVRSGGAISP